MLYSVQQNFIFLDTLPIKVYVPLQWKSFIFTFILVDASSFTCMTLVCDIPLCFPYESKNTLYLLVKLEAPTNIKM